MMTGLLLIQSLTGWCWHCPCDCAPIADHTAIPVAADDCCEDEQSPADSGKCNLECRGFCIYLPTEKPQVDHPDFSLPLDFDAVTLAARELRTGCAICWGETEKAAESEPPMRLHLLHQVMLI